MIERFHVQNYKALRDVTLELTPIHVLIGPNDSGKTSLVEALTALCHMARKPLVEAFQGRWEGRQLVWQQTPSIQVSFETWVNSGKQGVKHYIALRFSDSGRSFEWIEEAFTPSDQMRRLLDQGRASAYSALFSNPLQSELRVVVDAVARIQSYRWNPAHLALPVSYDFSTHFGMKTSGFGLAMYLNDILTYDHEKYGELEQRFRTLFPFVNRIRLQREPGFQNAEAPGASSIGLGIYFEQVAGGPLLSAAQASDGLILVLAYLAILFSPEPSRLLLIEEPENGIHPRRLADVLQVLKELVHEQTRTQVLLTTHSPYVVDQFTSDEVTLCLKGEDGAVTTHRLSSSKSVREQMDIFQLGEIWTAEGDEALATTESPDQVGSP
jgi:predicted ATPase